MYWTKYGGSIFKAEMDGTNLVEIVPHLGHPTGIAIDYDSSRLYWVDCSTNKVQSSNLEGTDVELVAQSEGCPWGIAVNSGSIFWGTYTSKSLQTSDKAGQDVRTLFDGTHGIQHLTVAAPSPVQTRKNHCEGQICSGICVLTADSFSCIA